MPPRDVLKEPNRGIALATAVFAANGHLGTRALFDAGFRPALAVAAVISALRAMTALGVATRRAQMPVSQPELSAATVAILRSSQRRKEKQDEQSG